MSAQHTPGQWHFTWNGEGQPGRIGVTLPCEPVDQCGYLSHCIALTQPGKFDARANAERIVQCVNAHDELVAALSDMVRKEWCEGFIRREYDSDEPDENVMRERVLSILAKAGVQP